MAGGPSKLTNSWQSLVHGHQARLFKFEKGTEDVRARPKSKFADVLEYARSSFSDKPTVGDRFREVLKPPKSPA